MAPLFTRASARHFGSVALLLLSLAGCLGQAQGGRGPQEFKSEMLQAAVDEAYAKLKSEDSGKNADYITYIATVPSQPFGMCIVTLDGRIFTAAGWKYRFST